MAQRVFYSLGVMVMFVMVMSTVTESSKNPLPDVPMIHSDDGYEFAETFYDRAVVFMFMKDNCPNCESQYPIFGRLAKDLRPRFVKFYVVSIDEAFFSARKFGDIDPPYYVITNHTVHEHVITGPKTYENLSAAIKTASPLESMSTISA